MADTDIVSAQMTFVRSRFGIHIQGVEEQYYPCPQKLGVKILLRKVNLAGGWCSISAAGSTLRKSLGWGLKKWKK
jgi:hypothetical protein